MRRTAITPCHGRLSRGLAVLSVSLLAVIWLSPLAVQAENLVEIESKWVEAGASNVMLGIYLTNDVQTYGVLMTYEIRSIHVGSFIRRTLDIRPQGRLLEWTGTEPPFTVKNFYPYRTRPNSYTQCPTDSEGNVWQWMESDSLPDFVGEEALLYYFVGMDFERPTMLAGTDGNPREGQPSAKLVFDVTEVGGAFIIDTTCMGPANHLSYIVDDPVAEFAILAPAFEKGIVLIGCNAECHGDPNCDGQCNLIDLIKSVDVAFNNAPPVIDPDPRCPVENTDVNCDLVTNVLDVVHMVNVQYRFSPMAIEFCVACEHIPRTGWPKEDVRTPYFRNSEN